MAVDVTVEQAIERKRGEVAAFASDPANDARWILALDSVRVLTDGPIGPGTRVERVASFLGKRMEYVNEIVSLDPGSRLDMRSVKAPFPMTVTYEWEDSPGGGTVMRIRTGGDASGFYRLAGPLLGAAVRKGVEKDLAELKRLMESREDGDRSPAAPALAAVPVERSTMSQSVYPAIVYQDAAAAVDFLERAFGFEQRAMHRDEQGRLAHGEIVLGGAIVMVGEESVGSFDLKSGRTLGGSAVCVYIAVEDLDPLAERARGAGAEMLRDLNDTDYGSREFTCRDPEGVIWSFGTYRPS